MAIPGLPGGFIISQGNPSISPKKDIYVGSLDFNFLVEIKLGFPLNPQNVANTFCRGVNRNQVFSPISPNLDTYVSTFRVDLAVFTLALAHVEPQEHFEAPLPGESTLAALPQEGRGERVFADRRFGYGAMGQN